MNFKRMPDFLHVNDSEDEKNPTRETLAEDSDMQMDEDADEAVETQDEMDDLKSGPAEDQTAKTLVDDSDSDTDSDHEGVEKPKVRIMEPAKKKERGGFHLGKSRKSDHHATLPSNALARKEGEKRPSRLFVQYYAAFCLLLAAIFVVSGYLLLEPKITNFKRINESINVTLKEIDDVERFLASVERSISAAEQIPEDTLLRVNESLPKEADIPNLLRTMSVIAEQNHVTMGGVQFAQRALTEEEKMAGLQLAPLDMNLTLAAPGYLATKSFLEDLERNVRLLDVKSINVGGEGNDGGFSYALELTTYILEEHKASVPSVLSPDGFMDSAGIPVDEPAFIDSDSSI